MLASLLLFLLPQVTVIGDVTVIDGPSSEARPRQVVLRMARLGGAQSLGMDDEIGTIATGKRADLVLLDASPLENISNTQRISLVVQGGRELRPSELLPSRVASRR